MPFKRQYGYIWTGATSDVPRTIAHELAHGAFRLRHTFSPEAFIATQGSTNNLMDYSSGATHLYKHQWDNVHNPESVTSWLQDDEEGAYTDVTLFVDYLGHEKVFVHDDIFTENDVVLIAPSGKPIQLPKTIIPSFTGLVKDKDGAVYDLGIPRGVLLAFKDGGNIYSSSFSRVDGEYVFNGYKLKGSDPVSFKVTEAPARSESKVVIGAEDEYCFLGIHSGYYSHANYSSEEDYQAAGPVITGSITLRDQETQGWIRIDNGCTRDIELATVSPSYNDILANGFVIVNPTDPNGVMFAYSLAVEGYEAGEATGYIYRIHNNDGGEDYFKWTGSVWERFELSDENQLDPSSDVLTLAAIWQAVKDDPVHASLDLAGFIPVVGMAADGVNAVIYYVEGDKLAATLSSIAIVSSGVVVGVKAIVRVVKNSKVIRSTTVLSDQFATQMEAVIKTAKDSHVGSAEAWYSLQIGVLELAGKHGEAGANSLSALSQNMDQVQFLRTANQINRLENSSDFIADLSKTNFITFIQANGEKGVDAWAKLFDAPDAIRRNIDLLEDVTNWPASWKLTKSGDGMLVSNSTGRQLGTVYTDKIVAPARKVTGEAGNTLINKTTLVKNMKYDVDGIIYQTDELGRVLRTDADLDDVVRIRLGNQQIKAVDVKDGVRGADQGGHIVGSRFFGPGEQINLYPQSANLNQGAWKVMENKWATEMVAGKDVKIKVEAIFEGTSQRPSSFRVDYTIDGQPFRETFTNQ